MTSLRDEVSKKLPPLSAPGLGLVRLKLEDESERLAKLYGGVTVEVATSSSDYEETKAALERSKDALTSVPPRLLRCVPFVLYDNREWRQDSSIIKTYLARIEREGRWALLRTLWTKYALGFENGDPTTNAVAEFLSRHFERLPERLAQFTRKYDFLNPRNGPLSLAQATLDGQELPSDLNAIGLNIARVRSSSLIVAILECIGQVLNRTAVDADPVSQVRSMLQEQTRDIIVQAPADPELCKRATKSIVEGFVGWQQRAEKSDANPEPVLHLLLELNRDPRFNGARWHGIVADSATIEVERWLCRATIEAFFRVVNSLQVDRQDM
jgi:hypothetical protein